MPAPTEHRKQPAQALNDRRRFVLDPAAWEAFQAILGRPAQAKPSLRRLLREPSRLEPDAR